MAFRKAAGWNSLRNEVFLPYDTSQRAEINPPPLPTPVGEWDVRVTGPNQITVFAMPIFFRPVATASAPNQITVSGEVEAMPTAFVIAPEANIDTDLTGATVVAFTSLPQVINGVPAGTFQIAAYGVNSTPLTVANPGDVTAPVLSGVSVTDTTTTATLAWSTNEANGTAYWLVDANTSRTAAQVIAGGAIAGSRAVTSVGAQAAFTATGLTAATSYFFHLVHQDAAGNSSIVSSTAFTTEAAVAAVDLVSTKDWLATPWLKASGAAKVVEDGWLLGPDTNLRLDTSAAGAVQWVFPAGQTLASISGQFLTAVVDIAQYGGSNTVLMDLRVFNATANQTYTFGVRTDTGVAQGTGGVRPLANGYYRCFYRFDPTILPGGTLTRVFLDIPKTSFTLTQFSRPCLFVGNLTDTEIDALTASTTPRVRV